MSTTDEVRLYGQGRTVRPCAAHELYVVLLGPVSRCVDQGQASSLIVPSGPLTALPLHLLVTDTPATAVPPMQASDLAAYREAAWLLKRQAITVLPIGRNLKALRVQPGTARAQADDRLW